jgi:hypothetical protein
MAILGRAVEKDAIGAPYSHDSRFSFIAALSLRIVFQAFQCSSHHIKGVFNEDNDTLSPEEKEEANNLGDVPGGL